MECIVEPGRTIRKMKPENKPAQYLMQLKAKIWNGMEEWVWGELERKGDSKAKSMDDEPDPARLVHCVASLQALMFLQYTLFASPGFSDSSLATYQCIYNLSLSISMWKLLCLVIICCSYGLEK